MFEPEWKKRNLILLFYKYYLYALSIQILVRVSDIYACPCMSAEWNKGICICLANLRFQTLSNWLSQSQSENQWQNLRHLLFSVVAWNQNKREMSVTSIRMSPAYRLEHWLLSWPWKLAVCSWQFAPESGIEFH